MWRCISLALLCFLLIITRNAGAQQDSDAALPTERIPSLAAAQEPMATTHDPDRGLLAPGSDPENIVDWHLLKRFTLDQKQFWSSTVDFGRKNPKVLLPIVAFTGITFASEAWISRQVPDAPSQLRNSHNISQLGVFTLIGATGGAWAVGKLTRNDHLQETGFLSAEAMLNSTAVTWALKQATQRPRPLVGDGGGQFFRGGNSFPSEHSALAWSAASILAHEYPGPLTKIFAYGLASAVTVTRITSKEHFASDALIGSALGWYIGRQVYRAHHNPELGGGNWGNFISASEEQPRSAENMGSPYVPMESWIYSAFDRLAALGYTQTAFSGMRPWTRMECARLLEEAEEQLRYRTDSGGNAAAIVDELSREFSSETARVSGGSNLGVSLDSVYTRATGISGTPLSDGLHFGQTIINDHGRPYGEGFNSITGFTAHAVAGPFAFFIQGEYQQAPSVPGYGDSVLQAISTMDGTPALLNARDATHRFRLLDTYVSYTFHNYQLSFGKQTLWLGPGDSGPLLFSNNAEPIWMLRINRTSPVKLPGVLHWMGPVRSEFFLGQLSGQHFVFSDPTLYGPKISPQPFIHGQKFSFKPTPNMEFGFSFTSVFGGPGFPFTWHNFIRTFGFSNADPGAAGDPGDRRGAFDFSYRIPHLRKWLTFYVDSLVEDEVSPLGSSRPALRPGVYLPRIPKLRKFDLRLEGVYTAIPNLQFNSGARPVGYYYFNNRYRSGYTNDGNLMASWIGRQGRGGQAWVTYWFSPRNKIQFNYRNAAVDREFLQGGHLHDFGIRSELMLRPNVGLSGFLQYEKWRFPLLSPTWQSNVTASVQLTFRPRWKTR
jgi:membrane-associated phospholipid phosphatase